jgi:negative regulator of sigma E activity
MTQTIEEQISAFCDGELPDEELELLLRRLERTEAHCATLARYSLIGELVRGEVIDQRLTGLRSNVMEAVAENPETQGQFVGRRLRQIGARVVPGIAGGGIAAAVAILALLSFNSFNSGKQSAPIAEPTVAANIVERGTVFPDQQKYSYTVPTPIARKAEIAPARLTSYLVSHGEYARTFPWTVMDSRIVGQQADAED